jgi:hypothetical protein
MSKAASKEQRAESPVNFGPGIKLALVRTYQHVLFNGNQESHFNPARANMANLEMVYYPQMHIISMRIPGVDHVYIVPPNVAYMKPVGDLEGNLDLSVDVRSHYRE